MLPRQRTQLPRALRGPPAHPRANLVRGPRQTAGTVARKDHVAFERAHYATHARIVLAEAALLVGRAERSRRGAAIGALGLRGNLRHADLPAAIAAGTTVGVGSAPVTCTPS